MLKSDFFELYQDYDPKVPVYCVTNSGKPTIHRFYDSSPLSPSGRYIALTEFPFEDRLPKAGDLAKVVVIDLETGQQVYNIQTAAWDTQVGAHVQWGADDHALFFNKMDTQTWFAYGCKVNIHSKELQKLDGTVYMVSPDGQYCISPSLEKLALVQPGYGAIVPNSLKHSNHGIADNDGLFVTNTMTGKKRLLLSFKAIFEAMPEKFSDIDPHKGAFYGFHAKYNPQGTRIAFIIRWLNKGGKHSTTKNYLITCDLNGEDITMAVNAKRWKGGHHPTWTPDGEHFIMNLAYKNHNAFFPKVQHFLERVARKLKIRFFSNATALRFAKIHYTGQTTDPLTSDHYGSGHPTMHPKVPFIMSDSYANERVAFGDNTVPLRWINLENHQMEVLVRIKTNPLYSGARSEFRIDPHPAWDKSGRYLVFNGNHDGGVRKVYIADCSGLKHS